MKVIFLAILEGDSITRENISAAAMPIEKKINVDVAERGQN